MRRGLSAAAGLMFSGMEGDVCDGGTVDVTGAQTKPTPAEWFDTDDAPPATEGEDLTPALYFTTTFCGPKDDPELSGSYAVRLAGFQDADLADAWLGELDALAEPGHPYGTLECQETATTDPTVLTGDVADGAVDVVDSECPSDLPPEATADVEPDRWSFVAGGPWVVATSVMQCGKTEQIPVEMGGGAAVTEVCTVRTALADQHQHIVETLLTELADV